MIRSYVSRLAKLEDAAGPVRPEEEIARDRELARGFLEWARERVACAPWHPQPEGGWEAMRRLSAGASLANLAEDLRAARERADQRLREGVAL